MRSKILELHKIFINEVGKDQHQVGQGSEDRETAEGWNEMGFPFQPKPFLESRTHIYNSCTIWP